MNEEKKLVPKLRFPEFQKKEGWSIDQLSDICEPQQWATISSSDLVEDGFPVYGANGFIGYYTKFNHEFETVAVTCRGSTCGEVSLIPPRSYITGNSMCLDGIDSARTSHHFVYQALSHRGFKDIISGSAQPQIVGNAIKKIEIALPQQREQQKIADCLSSLDELIAALACKVDALKTHKKGLMQQLFPREGETQPRLRFPEFRDAGDWEEKKLSTIAELTSSKRVHLSDYVPNGIPFFRGKEISLLKNNQIPEDVLFISEEYYEEISRRYGVPKIGDILITAVGTLGNVYCIQNLSKFYFKDGNLIWMKNISEDSLFLETLLNVKNKKVLSSAIGSSQKALTMVELNKLKFAFPKKDEQQRIANCLTSLDNLITATTQELETLKTHKKALMQQLFPSAEAVEK